MESLRQYLISAISAAFFCGIGVCILRDSASGKIIRFLCGLLLTVTLLQPLPGMRMDQLKFDFPFVREAEAASARGKEISAQALRARIQQESEAYILSKAAQMDASVRVQILLNDREPPSPEGIILEGACPDAAKQRLQSIIEAEFGIPKERQQWIEQN